MESSDPRFQYRSDWRTVKHDKSPFVRMICLSFDIYFSQGGSELVIHGANKGPNRVKKWSVWDEGRKIENLKGSRNGRKKLDTKERNEMTSDCRPRDERRCGRLTVRRERDYIRDKVGLDCLPLKRSGEVLYM
jgi:hypothetical protein